MLDVGSAQGMLGASLVGAGAVIDAVEPAPIYRPHASGYYRHYFAGTVEETCLPEAEYATVVCADVLEHLTDPLAVLRKLVKAARSDGVFLVSLPNVEHASALLVRLSGFRPRMDRGIFDRTHLHFFTRRTAETLLKRAGLRVISAHPTVVPLGLVWPRLLGGRSLSAVLKLQRQALQLIPRLFAFQWVFTALPRACDLRPCERP